MLSRTYQPLCSAQQALCAQLNLKCDLGLWHRMILSYLRQPLMRICGGGCFCLRYLGTCSGSTGAVILMGKMQWAFTDGCCLNVMPCRRHICMRCVSSPLASAPPGSGATSWSPTTPTTVMVLALCATWPPAAATPEPPLPDLRPCGLAAAYSPPCYPTAVTALALSSTWPPAAATPEHPLSDLLTPSKRSQPYRRLSPRPSSVAFALHTVQPSWSTALPPFPSNPPEPSFLMIPCLTTRRSHPSP